MSESRQKTFAENAGHLRFAPANVGHVLNGDEDATVRYGLDRGFESGQPIRLLTDGGTVFETALVDDVWTCELRHAYHDMTVAEGRNHPSSDTFDLLERLNSHYPDADIQLEDEVTVVCFSRAGVVELWACDRCGLRKSTCRRNGVLLCNQCAFDDGDHDD